MSRDGSGEASPWRGAPASVRPRPGEHTFVQVRGPGPRFSEAEARAAIAASSSYAETLRKLGMRAAGNNFRTIRKYAEQVWLIPTDHFHPKLVKPRRIRSVTPLAEILVEGSTYYSRGTLKRRLYKEGLKRPVCELCGQGETWRGRPMGLILDHINGVADDNRLENLQIVCPNCNATLDTFCGRQNRLRFPTDRCARCGEVYRPANARQRYCSRVCGTRAQRSHAPRPQTRKVVRPPYTHLVREVAALGFLATGRRYGVSDNAIRKWLRQYERERQAEQLKRDLVGPGARASSSPPRD